MNVASEHPGQSGQWHVQWPERLAREKFEFERWYPELELVTLDTGKLAWVGPVTSNSGRLYEIIIIYPDNYPSVAPRVYPLSKRSSDLDEMQYMEDLSKSPSQTHVMPDGSICMMFPSFAAAHATAIVMADAARFWLSGLEEFVETGSWSRSGRFTSHLPFLPEFRSRTPFFKTHTTINVEGLMGDLNIAGQAGAVGSSAHASHNTFNQLGGVALNPQDLATLANDLAELRKQMLQRAEGAEDYVAIGAIASAEQAAREGQPGKVVEYLRAAGNWALEAAQSVGSDLLLDAVKKAMGLE